jgi:DNA-binding NarL/FixJ family response regulator
MLVDDDSSARFLMRTILGDFPDEFEIVGETGLAAEALDLMLRSRPDVVLLDARMQLTDGYETATQLLRARPDVHLVLLSAVVDEEVRAQAQAAGIHACLDKGAFDDVPGVIRGLLSPGPDGSAAPG